MVLLVHGRQGISEGRGYKFIEIDVGADRQAYEEMKQLSRLRLTFRRLSRVKRCWRISIPISWRNSEEASDRTVMLFPLFLILGVAVLSVALRSFQNPFSQKAGAVGILVASYLLVYFLTNSHVWGAVAAASWFFLPWVEILTRIRALRLPKEKQLRPKSAPSTDTFPNLMKLRAKLKTKVLLT